MSLSGCRHGLNRVPARLESPVPCGTIPARSNLIPSGRRFDRLQLLEETFLARGAYSPPSPAATVSPVRGAPADEPRLGEAHSGQILNKTLGPVGIQFKPWTPVIAVGDIGEAVRGAAGVVPPGPTDVHLKCLNIERTAMERALAAPGICGKRWISACLGRLY
jgi:hypothetical protein